ncbi:MAG TPA: Fe-S-containing hydro-lyase [Rectinemataceae bacterium]|nr:Fe-S-containing hydro-lyase [Rectinemataceae bacterium]
MREPKRILAPLSDEAIDSLEAGDSVLITGRIFTARDAAHKRMIELLEAGKELPIPLAGQVLYYAGPTPARPGRVSGPIGPTTSGRMDLYTPQLLDRGLKGMIGKGLRSDEVIRSMVKNRAVYFAAVGGAAALIARCVKSSEVVAYPELGPEAIRRLSVQDFPAIVVIDARGHDLYRTAPERYGLEDGQD